jgi:hypothetical protein
MTPMGTNYKIQSPFWIFLKPFARFDSKILHLQEIVPFTQHSMKIEYIFFLWNKLYLQVPDLARAMERTTNWNIIFS